MSLIIDGLYTFLTTRAAITALVSTRIYLEYLPQNPTYPALVYGPVSSVPLRVTHDQRVGPVTERFQITAWASTGREAEQLAEKVRIALTGHKGDLGGVTVQGVFHAGSPGLLYEPETVIREYYRPEDFYITYAMPS